MDKNNQWGIAGKEMHISVVKHTEKNAIFDNTNEQF